jgi:hypothetical protein
VAGFQLDSVAGNFDLTWLKATHLLAFSADQNHLSLIRT